MARGELLIRGVVGSTAYGLAREGSDVDRLSVFVTPASEIAGWDWTEKQQTVVTNNPDSTAHEVRKFMRLVAKGNPSVTELLWLDEYERVAPWGQALIDNRERFLSTTAVRNAYFGYATAQLTRLKNRGDSFSSDTKNRTAKHARHVMRLLEQAEGLFRSGFLRIKVGNPDWYFEMDDWGPELIEKRFNARLSAVERAADESVLPDRPNEEWMRRALQSIRETYR